ncbi:MAG: hypothetical protein IJK42_09755 [Prevotella sp.]|nr:hypothetical protein [Prevotella sp.]
MKINKLYLGLFSLLALMFTGCKDGGDDSYDWATVSGNQVFFSNELPATQEITRDVSSFTVPINRINTAEAITVPVTLTSEDNFFTAAASSVSFAANQAVTYLTINYDPSLIQYDEFRKVVLTIGDETYTTPYGKSVYEFLGGMSAPYISLGYGTFVEDYLWGFERSVEILQNQEYPNMFRAVGCFPRTSSYDLSVQSPYLDFRILTPGEEVRGVTVTQPDLIYFEDYHTGYLNSSYDNAEIMIYHPSKLSNTKAEDYWLHNVVLAYQEDGKTPGQVQLAPRYYMDGIGGWNASQEDGAITITFPGFVVRDYSVEYDYAGVFTNPSGDVFAMGTLALGADATNVKAIVVSQDDDAEAVADAVAAGEVEATDVSAGTIYVPIGEEYTGKLQVVVVVIDEGEVKGLATANFEYYGGGANPWQSLGMGYYTDDLIVPLFTEAGQSYTYQVEIQENTETPGIYRLVKLYAPVAAAFGEEGGNVDIEVNAEDPTGVYILDQPVGLDFGYGAISIETDAGYYVSKYGFDAVKAQLPNIFATLADGVISFPVLEGQSSSGATVQYQAWVNMGSSSYYGGRNGELQIVLPSASASAKAKAVRKAKAADFARRLYRNFDSYKKDMRETQKILKRAKIDNM